MKTILYEQKVELGRNSGISILSLVVLWNAYKIKINIHQRGTSLPEGHHEDLFYV